LGIIFLTGFYPPPENSNGVRIHYFVRELRRRGYNVTVIKLYPRIYRDLLKEVAMERLL
jgi:hypothetical protein